MSLFAYPHDMAAHLIVSDEDSADFLQSQFSNDLRPFAAGQCTYGLWLDVKGKIVADSWILCEGEERFRIFSELCEGDVIQKKLENHIIADDVELEMGPLLKGLSLVGEGAADFAAKSEGCLFRLPGRHSSLPSCELVFADEASRHAWIVENECEVVSEKWIDQERMKSGVPVLQCEVLPGDLPAEAGLVEAAVSLTKGCFLGQEVVARMHNVGRPQRGLYLLSGSGEPPEALTPVSNGDGKTLGELRTSLTTLEGWQGVAMLKSRFVESGVYLSVGESQAEVKSVFKRSCANGRTE